MDASKKPLKTAQYVYRPPPMEDNLDDVYKRFRTAGNVAESLMQERSVMLPVFQFLTTQVI